MSRSASRAAEDAPFRKLRVAAVVDEFTRASLAPEVTLLDLNSVRFPIELLRFRPDMLFVESAWRGSQGSWKGKLASYPGKRRSRRLGALRLLCKAASIPTVFWNKEDPVHYDRFIASARGFDFVFTTAAERVADYTRDLSMPPSRVGVLAFAFQPRIYHPGCAERDGTAVFAGSYGESHFPARRAALEMLLDAALGSGRPLKIFDRTALAPDRDKVFPVRFQAHVAGSRDYQALAAEYQGAGVGINVNSVTESSTMFSRRVLEMLACGLPVVSTPARGIQELLPGLVSIASTPEEALRALKNPLPAPNFDALATEHSMASRLGDVVRAVGLR